MLGFIISARLSASLLLDAKAFRGKLVFIRASHRFYFETKQIGASIRTGRECQKMKNKNQQNDQNEAKRQQKGHTTVASSEN